MALVLGDNIFYGTGFSGLLKSSVQVVEKEKKAVVFGYEVKDPERYGVIEFDKSNKVISIEEKPKKPKSNIAITGLYFFDHHAAEYSKDLKPSGRGELTSPKVPGK